MVPTIIHGPPLLRFRQLLQRAVPTAAQQQNANMAQPFSAAYLGCRTPVTRWLQPARIALIAQNGKAERVRAGAEHFSAMLSGRW
jgi:hypothetical protein